MPPEVSKQLDKNKEHSTKNTALATGWHCLILFFVS
jgi:hypothetical protein